MRILLINPPYPKGSVGFEHLMTLEPLALEYLGAILKKEGHEIKILDAVLDKNIERALRDFDPQVVSCTCFYIHMYVIRDLFKRVKRYNEEITTIVAGSHAILFPEEFYIKDVDIVNVGEDLLVAPRLMEGIERNRLEGIEGIHYRSAGEWKVGPPATRCISIDELPFPDRSLTKEYHKQYYWYFEEGVASVWGSVGCPFKCYYCTQWSKNGGKFVSRKPESLIEEILNIDQESVFIIDDNTFTDRNRAWEIVRLIKEKGIKKKFMCYCSPNLIIKNRDIISQWKECGLCKLMVGFESFREQDLKDVNKKTSMETNKQAIDILDEIGIDTMAGFIIYPDFTKKDFKFLRKYVKDRRLYYIEYTSLTPFPGTVFYEQVKDEIIEHNPELYDMQHMLLESKLPLKKYYKEIMLTYLASYMPHRAVRARLNFKLSLNPMHPIYRSFIQFLFKVKRSYKDHEVIMPELKTESRKKSEERRKESWIKKQSEQIS